MGRGVGLPRDKGKNWDWDVPRARNTLWNQPWPHPWEICQGQIPPLTKVKLLVSREQHIPHFKTKLPKKQIQGKGRDSYPEQTQEQDGSNHVRREGKILKQHRGTGLGLLLRLWESETVSKLDFILGQGFSMRDTHMHFCFQNSWLSRGNVGITFTFVPLYQTPVMLKCQRQKFHLSGRNMKVYGTTENWKSELPWALQNKVTCSQGEMKGAE